MDIEFTVYGKPATAGSKRGFINKKTGKIIMAPADKNSGSWRKEVVTEAKLAYSGPPLTGPIAYTMTFYFARPNYHYGSGKNAGLVKMKYMHDYFHTKKPDAIKLARAVEDALNGVVWRDDAQVAWAEIKKLYTTGKEQVTIRIRELAKNNNGE